MKVKLLSLEFGQEAFQLKSVALMVTVMILYLSLKALSKLQLNLNQRSRMHLATERKL